MFKHLRSKLKEGKLENFEIPVEQLPAVLRAGELAAEDELGPHGDGPNSLQPLTLSELLNVGHQGIYLVFSPDGKPIIRYSRAAHIAALQSGAPMGPFCGS